jgi:hypothetical protein
VDVQRVSRTSRPNRLTALAVFAAPTAACTIPFCPYGTLPWDGQTDVPADVVIALFDDDLPEVLPNLDDYVRVLHVGTGREIPFTAQVDRAAGRIDVRPDVPLADGDYELSVFTDATGSANGHWISQTSRDSTFTTFTVGPSSARALGVVQRGTDAVVGFSEPVSLDGMMFRVDDLDVAPIGYLDAHRHLVVLPPGALVDLVAGSSIDGDALVPGPLDPALAVEAWTGVAYCANL